MVTTSFWLFASRYHICHPSCTGRSTILLRPISFSSSNCRPLLLHRLLLSTSPERPPLVHYTSSYLTSSLHTPRAINMASNSGTSGSPASGPSHLPSPETFSEPPSSNASPVSAPPSLYSMGRASDELDSPEEQRTSISDAARPAAASVLRSHSSSVGKGGCWYVSMSVPPALCAD